MTSSGGTPLGKRINSATDITKGQPAALNYQNKIKNFLFEVSGANVLNDVSRVAELCDLRTATLRDEEMERQYGEHRLETSLRRNTALGMITIPFDLFSIFYFSVLSPYALIGQGVNFMALGLAFMLLTDRVSRESRRSALKWHRHLSFAVYAIFLFGQYYIPFTIYDGTTAYLPRQPNFWMVQCLNTGMYAVFGLQLLAYKPKITAAFFVVALVVFIFATAVVTEPAALGWSYFTSVLVFLVIVAKVLFAAALHRYRAAVSHRLNFHWVTHSSKTIDLKELTSPQICGVPTYLRTSKDFNRAYDESMTHSFFKGANISLIIDIGATVLAYFFGVLELRPSLLVRLIMLCVIMVVFNALFLVVDKRRPANRLTLINLLCVAAITLDNVAFLVDNYVGFMTLSRTVLYVDNRLYYKVATACAAVLINMASLLAAGHRLSWFVGASVVNLLLLLVSPFVFLAILPDPEGIMTMFGPYTNGDILGSVVGYSIFPLATMLGLLVEARAIFKAQLKSYYLFSSK
jgi:hypothetical protein